MNAASRMASLNLVCLLLGAPVFFLWLQNPDVRVGVPRTFSLFAAAIIYVVIAAKVRPKSVYDGARKIGVSRRGFQFALLFAAIVMIAIPVLDCEGEIARVAGLGLLIVSAILYASALMSVLYADE